MTSYRPRLRDNSLRFDSHITSECQEVEHAVEAIFSGVLGLRSAQGIRVNDPAAIRLHVKVIALNGYLAFRSQPYVYRAVSKRAPDYSRRVSRYFKAVLSVHHIRGVMADMVSLGLIKVFNGYLDRTTQRSFSTRFRAKAPLAAMMESYGVDKSMIGRIATESIKLRNSEKVDIDYEETDTTRKMRASLELINQQIEKRRIHLSFTNQEMDKFHQKLARDSKRPPIDFDAVTLHRTFNNSSFEQGGRFYGGWWQNMPKEARPYIEIDYKETVEIDYSGMHIRMLYGAMAIECPDEPYDLEDFSREHQKTAILIIINSASREAAIRAISSEGIKHAKQLCDALTQRHNSIKSYFFTGTGIELQFLDSQIAESVMLKVIALGGVALPVHDSFIVRTGREEELETAMDEAFQEIYPTVPPLHKRKETRYQRYNREHPRADEDEFLFVEFDEDELKLQIERTGEFR